MDKTLQIQSQIRRNADEISSYMADMGKWEKGMKEKDKKIRTKKPTVAVRNIGSGVSKNREVGTVPINTSTSTTNDQRVSGNGLDPSMLTPSTITDTVPTSSDNNNNNYANSSVAKARGTFTHKDPEEAEREKGNAAFKSGNFPQAIKSYTKCLGLKSRNYIAFSNRAMAYIKTKEFHRAVEDCTNALALEPSHVKSLNRRATSFNALGKHRAAIYDLMAAMKLDPSNKQLRVDLQSSKEMLRNATSRAPLQRISVSLNMKVDHETEESHEVSTNQVVNKSLQEILELEGPEPAPHVLPKNSDISKEEVEDLTKLSSGEEEKKIDILMRDSSNKEIAKDDIAKIEKPHLGKKLDREDSVQMKSDLISVTETTRIQINDESDDEGTEMILKETESDFITIDVKESPSKTKSTRKPEQITPLSDRKSKLDKKGKEESKNQEGISNTYELERRLLSSKDDDKAIARLFKELKKSQLKKILQKQIEPNILVHLIVAIKKYFGDLKQKWDKAAEWVFMTVSSVNTFSISLIPSQSNQIIVNALNDIERMLGEESHTELIPQLKSTKNKFAS